MTYVILSSAVFPFSLSLFCIRLLFSFDPLLALLSLIFSLLIAQGSSPGDGGGRDEAVQADKELS